MTRPDWKQMPTAARVDAVAALAAHRLSFGQIAAKFDGATRSAMAGFCNRHKIKVDGRSPAAPKPAKTARAASPRPRGNTASKPLPPAALPPSPEFAKPFLDTLLTGGCKWPLWDTFEGPTVSKCCGAARDPEAPFCDYHMRASVAPRRAA